MKVHVRVYKVIGMAEVSIDVTQMIPRTAERAGGIATDAALRLAQEGSLEFGDPDKEHMAVALAIDLDKHTSEVG